MYVCACLVKRFIRKGIPHHLRYKVWTLSAERMVQQHNRRQPAEKRVHISVEEGRGALRSWAGKVDPDTLEQIRLDVPRTFPEHEGFADGSEMLQTLERILCAFTVLHPDMGYTQGLNFVSSILYLTTRDEVQTLFLLRCIVFVYVPGMLLLMFLEWVLCAWRVCMYGGDAKLPAIVLHFTGYFSENMLVKRDVNLLATILSFVPVYRERE